MRREKYWFWRMLWLSVLPTLNPPRWGNCSVLPPAGGVRGGQSYWFEPIGLALARLSPRQRNPAPAFRAGVDRTGPDEAILLKAVGRPTGHAGDGEGGGE